jgi:hypothetical protein
MSFFFFLPSGKFHTSSNDILSDEKSFKKGPKLLKEGFISEKGCYPLSVLLLSGHLITCFTDITRRSEQCFLPTSPVVQNFTCP